MDPNSPTRMELIQNIQQQVLADVGLTPRQYLTGMMAMSAVGLLVIFGFIMNITMVGAVIGIPMWILAVVIGVLFPIDQTLEAYKRIKAGKKALGQQQAVVDVQVSRSD